eukprot:scaffold117435_cov32-Prasinocladus_malaysianus.AAC.1
MALTNKAINVKFDIYPQTCSGLLLQHHQWWLSNARLLFFPPADELLLDLEKFTGRSASDSYDDNPVAAVPELIESLGRDASELINSLTMQERAAEDN